MRLVACLGVLDKYLLFYTGVRVFELITQAHAAFHFIHILSSGTTAAKGVPTETRHINVHLDGVVHQGSNIDAGKTRHTFALSIERTHAHQTVHAVLTFEVPKGVVAFYLHCHALDAGAFAF